MTPNGIRSRITAGLLLMVVHTASAGAQSEVAHRQTVRDEAARCPLTIWRGKCRRLTAAEKDRILRLLESYALDQRGDCGRARAAVIAWIKGGSEAWVFGSHTGDNALRGQYVLAETAHDSATRRPAGLGFRSAVMAVDPVLVRVAMHEGAHLAGEGEEQAHRVETQCVMKGD